MPCDHPDHAGHHNWPDSGELRIWPCERACDYCTYQARDSSALRAHVRDVHKVGDYPDIAIQPGLNRPPVFDPAIHGTSPRPSRQQTLPSPDEINDAIDQLGEFVEQPDNETQETQSPYAEGPSSSAARGRKIQVTPKAAAAAAEEAESRKRKRGGQRIPGEIFPPRMARPRQQNGYYSPGGHSGDFDMAESVRVRALRRPDGSRFNEQTAIVNFKSSLAGLFYFAEASGLDASQIALATQQSLLDFQWPRRSETKDEE